MKFAIRVDDVAWTADEIEPPPCKAPDVGLTHAQRFHAAMQGQPYLAGIIPTCLDAEGHAWLRSQPPGLTPAIHGWTHRRVEGVDSEYRDLTLWQMRERLEAAKHVIGPTQHTIPPFNAVEADFPQACYLENIQYIWGAPSTWPTPPQPYPAGSILLVPSWMPTYAVTVGRMNGDMKPLLETLPNLLKFPGQAVITLHIPWELGKDPTFDGVKRMVDLLGDRILSPEEYVGTS